jgi:hypothetical protein
MAAFLSGADEGCLGADSEFADALGEHLFEVFQGLGEAFDSLFEFVVGHAVFGVHLVEGGFLHRYLLDVQFGGVGGI